MKPPIELSGEALAYWKAHSRKLKDAGILTDRDVHSFALLCRIWGMLQALDTEPGNENYRAMIQFTNLSKQYAALAKQFGLLPRDRKAANMELESKATDEFGL